MIRVDVSATVKLGKGAEIREVIQDLKDYVASKHPDGHFEALYEWFGRTNRLHLCADYENLAAHEQSVGDRATDNDWKEIYARLGSLLENDFEQAIYQIW